MSSFRRIVRACANFLRLSLRHKFTFIIAFAAILLAALLYYTPERSYDLENELEATQEAISVGQSFAEHLFEGRKSSLQRFPSETPATEKILAANFVEIDTPQRLDLIDRASSNYPGIDCFLLLGIRGSFARMELVRLERNENLVVVTFAVTTSGIVKFANNKSLLYTVALRFVNPDGSRLARMSRRIANLPVLKLFTGRLKTPAKWFVMDYHFEYGLADYYQWVLKEIEKQKPAEFQAAALESLLDFNFAQAEKEMLVMHLWTSYRTGRQIPEIERTHDQIRTFGEKIGLTSATRTVYMEK